MVYIFSTTVHGSIISTLWKLSCIQCQVTYFSPKQKKFCLYWFPKLIIPGLIFLTRLLIPGRAKPVNEEEEEAINFI